jgi:hypothetical protein
MRKNDSVTWQEHYKILDWWETPSPAMLIYDLQEHYVFLLEKTMHDARNVWCICHSEVIYESINNLFNNSSIYYFIVKEKISLFGDKYLYISMNKAR